MSKNKLSTEPYKGVRDFYPEDQALLAYMMKGIRAMVEKAGYVEYGASVLEPADLYRSKNAVNEEIINDQTYTFTDRGGREVTLRPEMTPTVARMVSAKRRELGFPLRLYCIPNFFRYERPQRGRLREFWQLNVDLFGSKSLAADAEVLGVAYGVMRAFGAKEDDFTISVGYRPAIEKVAQDAGLSPEATARLFGLLDKRGKMPEADFDNALREIGVSAGALPKDPPPEIAQMMRDFATAGINNIVFDPSIVRGFAYYTGIVFEVFDTHPDNNRSLFGGGRYDNLTALFDDEPLTGVGFGMGLEALRLFLEVRGLLPAYTPPTKVYVAVTSPELAVQAQTLAGEMRAQGINVAIDFGDKKLGDQIKTAAEKLKIPYLIVVGPDELASGEFMVKNLATGAQERVARTALAGYFTYA